jgi:hypothetical protein
MKRTTTAVLALVLALGLMPQAARAQNNNWNPFTWFSHNQDPRLTAVGIGVGAGAGVASYLMARKHGNPAVRHASYGTAYGVTAFACAAVYPIVGTIVLNRPLTPREMYDGVADCVVPVIGGWLVDSWLPHTAWIDGTPPPRPRARHHK